MKPSSPGFIGKRLTEAREARGLTITALGEILGITKQSISQYEKDLQTPRPEIMERISNKLNLPKHFFLTPVHELPSNTIFYRSMSAATKRARTCAERKFYWLKEIVNYLRTFIVFKEVNFPSIVIKDPFKLSSNDIEHIATQSRRHWNLSDNVISHVVMLLENNGVIITYGDLDNDKLDAFSEWSEDDNTPYIFLGSDKQSAVRSRFDAAHELGHIVLHRSVSKSEFFQTVNHKILERQAHRFASAFLLPEETFMRDLYAPTLDAFLLLKDKWKVSIGMMIKRCEDIGIVNEDSLNKLWINYSRRGWRKKEPLDDKLAIEKPIFLRRCIELLIDNSIQSRDDILIHLPFAPSDIEKLAVLPENYMDPKQEKVEPLPLLRKIKEKTELKREGNSNVIPLHRK